ncbi:tetratricopeptide repeat protein [Thiospirillum jenense]|uniref:Tetratricopeptide repeat protein n=1 Tax=Thiospirillum jenense TaxID=1653858 RepID=A0A839HGC5_9GAMM|nr:tetratricopeptide repeat protein [Thiospirillum jenense]MBB1125372.1 tetratricopeptide repeat protein [Thiospirillum jenense]
MLKIIGYVTVELFLLFSIDANAATLNTAALSIVGKNLHGIGPVTIEEIKFVPQPCVTIGMGEINGTTWLDHNVSLHRPEDAMARNAIWFHHYCWGLVHKFRSLSARDEVTRKFESSQWRKEMQFVVGAANQYGGGRWPYLFVVHKEIAAAYLAEQNYIQAAAAARRALELKPNLISAHLILADALIANGQRDEALKTLQTAMRLKPNSALLQRRYRVLMNVDSSDFPNQTVTEHSDITVKSPKKTEQPEPPVQIIKSSASKQQVKITKTKIKKLTNTTQQKKQPNSELINSKKSINDDAQKSAAPISSSHNPYCRFCPVD